MITFADYLRQKNIAVPLSAVLTDLATVFVHISGALSGRTEGYEGTENAYGDKQVKMDLVSNDFFVAALKENQYVSVIGSEELPEPLRTGQEGGLSVFFDPLDGSSVVDANLAVGSIVGIFGEGDAIGQKGRDQVASLMCVYGPRLTFLVTFSSDSGVHEFLFDEETKQFVLFHENVRLNEEGKIYSPGNLNAAKTETWYSDLLQYWIENGYKLRYSGGMVPDVNQLFKKGGGVFLYPGSAERPQGKLRLLFECAPIALIMERAGGVAYSHDVPVLDVPISSYDQQIPVVLGSSMEVTRVLEFQKKAVR